MKFGGLSRVSEEIIRVQPARFKAILDDMMQRLERLAVNIKREDNMKGRKFSLQISKGQPFVLNCNNPIAVSIMSAVGSGNVLIKPIYGWIRVVDGAQVELDWSEAPTTATVVIFVEEE